jgi:hypothetical protein
VTAYISELIPLDAEFLKNRKKFKSLKRKTEAKCRFKNKKCKGVNSTMILQEHLNVRLYLQYNNNNKKEEIQIPNTYVERF